MIIKLTFKKPCGKSSKKEKSFCLLWKIIKSKRYIVSAFTQFKTLNWLKCLYICKWKYEQNNFKKKKHCRHFECGKNNTKVCNLDILEVCSRPLFPQLQNAMELWLMPVYTISTSPLLPFKWNTSFIQLTIHYHTAQGK